MVKKDSRYREIPYNYTSFSDKEIILKYFNEHTWDVLNQLRAQRITGRSAKLLYEIIGDVFVIERNPYLYDNFLKSKNKLKQLKNIHQKRLETVESSAENNSMVEDIIRQVRSLNDSFFKSFASTRFLRQRILFSLNGITAFKNIQYTPFHRILHSTDASDWRVEYPFTVIYPDNISEIPKVIKAAKKLGLSIIPRGGGTGLTGGAVPVNNRTMVINTEKLSKIDEIEVIQDNGKEIPIISVETGVVTDDVIEYCEQRGFIFATDPTSAWASTIGGNIAENAGGKKCVMWGTAIDNLYSFTMVDPNGDTLIIRRYHHPYRKIHPEDVVEFNIYKCEHKKEVFVKNITLNGTDIRKKGLGKDITNKVLNGLPGIQKEGGDGIIVSAQFVLYRPFKYCKTLCLEFFGTNMVDASRAIVAINNEFKNDEDVYLTALEHFDEKYVAAINYKNKSKRNEPPKAVLLVDIESEDKEKLYAACLKTNNMVSNYNAEGILAEDEQERKMFWNDRKHLGAIAKHTNAFKLNEDIVIPLERLPEFADFVELMNFIMEIKNSLSTIELVNGFLVKLLEDKDEDFPEERTESFIKRLNELSISYLHLLAKLEDYKNSGLNPHDENASILRKLQDNTIKFSFNKDVVYEFRKVFHGYDNILEEFNRIVKSERSRKLIIATHMHAGDGNVHVNIPVHSSDPRMMQEADECAALAMKEADRLGGVVSGEHGIGLTKLKFIEKSVLDRYQDYKNENDPDNLFNPGKLTSNFPLHQIYTPSFNLLEREAIILESTDLEELSQGIASCVRCGKCKGVCNTHYPVGSLFYNPRNKILAVGMVTEAVLFSAQTLDMKSFNNFKNLREIADHCTVCHKCQVPCPVKIDFGEISLKMRKQLKFRRKAPLKMFTSVALFYLGRKKYYINKLLRIAIMKIGYSAQRITYKIIKPIERYSYLVLPKINHMLKTQFPKSNTKPIREILKLKGQNMFYSFENPQIPVSKSVVYFPGCGSERMIPEISLATIALLYYSGVRVVIPPEYLCCGYPFLANGKTGQTDLKSYENRVIFHRIADAASYLNFEAVIVSCGTCYEMLEKYDIENIFNGGTLMDINEFLAEEKLFSKKIPIKNSLLYHEPCHTPLKSLGYEKVFKELFNEKAVNIPNCCGEAGTLALSRPDLSNILRKRKENNISSYKEKTELEILTTCPSCVMGLSKLNGSHKVNGKSLVVFTAEQYLGKDWQKKFIKTIKKNGVEKIIF